MGRIFQDPLMGTAASMTIEENLGMADLRGKTRTLRWGVSRSRREHYVRLLKQMKLGLEDRLKQTVNLLSGGQRQSLTLLMATLSLPKLLLLDEHTAALDPKTAIRVMTLTAEIIHQHQLTAIMVTHNMEQAIKYGNRLIMLAWRQSATGYPWHRKRILYRGRGRQAIRFDAQRRNPVILLARVYHPPQMLERSAEFSLPRLR